VLFWAKNRRENPWVMYPNAAANSLSVTFGELLAAHTIALYTQAFDATDMMRFPGPDGTTGHAGIKIEHSPIGLADGFPDMGYRSPQAFGGAAVRIVLYIGDIEARLSRAIAAGAKALPPVADRLYGDRAGILADLFGPLWTLATHKEDVDLAAIPRRFEAGCGQQRHP
jgi:PhnB protein